MPTFPHLNDTRFPDVGNIDVYKYQNEFDYNRYDNAQMRIMLCSVPWDMGEAHVGNRTISGIGNVVWFGTEAARDAWFDAVPDSQCHRFDTKYRELHRDNQIDVPVPFDVACQFNYLYVRYFPMASSGDLVQYETENGLDRWFWFIREVEFIAPNTTRLHLLNDAFQTFMYRIDITGMVLERGHAPLFSIDTDTYLSNPIANNAGLLADDVNYGNEPSRVRNSTAHVFNSDTWCCIVTSASPQSANWGSKADDDWTCPVGSYYLVNGAPNYHIIALDVASLDDFLSNMESDYPQFAQTVKGVFFAPKELVTLGTKFQFANVDVYPVSTSNKTIDFTTITKAQFGYPSQYAHLAKLYTSPYSHIEITDENGDVSVIRIEDTTGKLQISAALSLAFPAIQVQAHILGAGGSNSTLSFKNITSHSLAIGGKWYETIHSWDVPVFGIVQSGARQNDYATHFDRKQQKTAYDNTYASETASATTERANAKATATTTETNAGNSAGTITDNAALQVAANTAMTAAGTTLASADTSTAQSLNTAQTNNAIDYTNASANNQIQMTEATAAASQASNAVNSAVSAGGQAISGNVPGAIAAAVSGITSAVSMQVTTEAGVNYTSAQAAASAQNNRKNAIDTNQATYDKNQHAVTAAESRRDAGNTLTSGAAANNAATMIANAANSRQTAHDNADRTYNTATANAGRTKDTAQNAVTNSVAQAKLNAPFEYGAITDTAQATTKPLALLANIVTQSANAIKQAGDEFLRYGYYYNAQWEFDGNWNVGKNFTYWKLADFWVSGLNIPDMYVDKIRFFLFGGVTVWRRPEDIGNVTIYENV